MTTIFASRITQCPFSATIEFIERLHRSDDTHTVGPFPALQTSVRCELAETRDYTDRSRIHEALVLRWRANAGMPLPVLRGMITVRPEGRATQIRIEAKYRPPLGPAGRVFDALAGRWLARRTIDRFLNEVSRFVAHQWAQEAAAASQSV
ncbi:MAG TPA: hypothetical protein VIO32_00210 [Candidatus Baltobacteraceae bacterium]